MRLFSGWGRAWLVGMAAGVVVAVVAFFGLLEFLELKTLDFRFQLRGPIPPRAPIVIISIDEDSFDELDLAWPFPRALHGQLLDIVAGAGAVAVGVDILFIEPSVRGPEDDRALGDAVALAGNVVLAAVFTEIREATFFKEDLNPPLKVVREGAAAFGFVNLLTDRDAFVRSGDLGRVYQGADFLSFDHHLYRLAVKAGIPAQPLPRERAVRINYRGPRRTFPTVPYYQVLNGEVDPEVFKGKIVLVGVTATSLHDEFPAPFSGGDKTPGVEIHANLLETLLLGNQLTRSPQYVGTALALLAACLAAFVTSRMRPLWAFLLLLGGAVAYGWVTFGLFAGLNLWVEVMPFQTALVLSYGTTVVIDFIREQREKRRLSRFFSPDVIKEILDSRADSTLLGSRRRITILFSDIRGFTSLSEKLQPEEVVEMLREYLTVMTEIVFKHGGTVDKYVGDCIMALYGAPFEQPNHAEQAVRTGLEFQEQVKILSDRWEARCGARVRNGVGINTGEAVVGTIGSEQRLEYTAIGDAVNLASRLESITKEYMSPIIVSQSTYDEVKHLFPARYLGEVKVKGKEIPVKIYAITKEEGRQPPPRVILEAPVMIVDEGSSVVATMTDLSASGVGVQNLPKPIPRDRIVSIRIDLPGLPKPVTADGRAAWSEKDKVGLTFVGLPVEDENLLEDFVKRQAPVSASRPPE